LCGRNAIGGLPFHLALYSASGWGEGSSLPTRFFVRGSAENVDKLRAGWRGKSPPARPCGCFYTIGRQGDNHGLFRGRGFVWSLLSVGVRA
jgi:hypothetical protein